MRATSMILILLANANWQVCAWQVSYNTTLNLDNYLTMAFLLHLGKAIAGIASLTLLLERILVRASRLLQKENMYLVLSPQQFLNYSCVYSRTLGIAISIKSQVSSRSMAACTCGKVADPDHTWASRGQGNLRVQCSQSSCYHPDRALASAACQLRPAW